VPEKGYLTDTAYGPGWACERGLRRQGEDCIALTVPDNAYLDEDDRGEGWTCARGFRKAGGACVALELPENAHLNYTGGHVDRVDRRLT
jgi:hypothetical protein